MLRALKSRWLHLVIPLAIYGIGVYYVFSLKSPPLDREYLLSVLTGIILIWYTWETMQLRQAAFEQIELQLRPFLVFRTENLHCFVENVGNVPALNVRIDSVYIGEQPRIWEIRFPYSVPLLKSGQSLEVRCEIFKGEQGLDPMYAAHLDPKYASLDLKIHIHFSNIEGKQYSLTQTVSPRSLKLLGFNS